MATKNKKTFDLFVIGGGVNGCGIARDAIGRNLSVFLAERADIAIGTSSASTKLIHGGLRYLEHYEFMLVRESLKEREVLLNMAPHIAWPMRFVLPHHSGLRPAWLIRLGLFLYDNLGGRKILPACKSLNLRKDPAGAALQDHFVRGFEYSDCWVDDARLVFLNARDAADRGAEVRTRTEVTAARRVDGAWQIDIRNTETGKTETVQAKALVNAGGPWVADILGQRLGVNSRASVRLVKGSHIVVPKIFDHQRAYIFQNSDARIVFAIPYEQDFTLIGTTDVDFEGDPSAVAISDDETSYLCDAVSAYFETDVKPDDVVWTYSGIRPLYDDGSEDAQKATRDFVLDLNAPAGEPPLLNVFGGKITTYRHLAEETLKNLKPYLDTMGPEWTRGATLPGGDFPIMGFDKLVADFRSEISVGDQNWAERVCHAYGTKAAEIFADAKDWSDLGQDFGGSLTEREVRHLISYEWCRAADDILWRRSKLGIRLSKAEKSALADWMEKHLRGTVMDQDYEGSKARPLKAARG